MADASVAESARIFRERKALIGVIGLGYVGLPLVLAACGAGYRALGFDIDVPKADALNMGKSPLKHVGDQRIASIVANGQFEATSDFSRLSEPDALLVCVPTPIGRHREPNLSFIESTAADIGKCLRSGQLVVLESTTYPGTTRLVVKVILERSGLRSGKDFFLAYSPEREDPGNAKFETSTIPKVIAGDDDNALQIACALYEQIVSTIVPVSSPETAEAVKLTENIFRAVNIALVNELKIVYAEMGIDIFEVIDAAKTKPFGFMPFYPGPGLGGHCIPIDPFYLTWKAREYGISTRFIELAGEINTSMPRYVVERLREALDRRFGKGLSRSRILVIGLAYKRDIDDVRESPALEIITLLHKLDTIILYHDPFVPAIPSTRRYALLAGTSSTPLRQDVLSKCDAVVIVTDHSNIDYGEILQHAKLILDTRGALPREAANVVPA